MNRRTFWDLDATYSEKLRWLVTTMLGMLTVYLGLAIVFGLIWIISIAILFVATGGAGHH